MAGKKEKAKARKAAAAQATENPKSDKSNQFSAFEMQGKGAAPDGTKFAYFEINPSHGKGLGAFATRPIRAGTSIFSERPLMIIEKPRQTISEDDIVAAYRRLTDEGKRTFDSMRNCHGLCGCKSGLFFANTFGMETGATGCYPISSRLNHSCKANCSVMATGDCRQKEMTVLRDVEAGEELTFHYVENVQCMTFGRRRQFLESDSFGFTCKCHLCSLPSADRFVSDCRRHMMRHLLYWMNPFDHDLAEVPPAFLGPKRSQLSELGFASCLLLFAQLADAEGSVAGDRVGISFVKLILFVIFKAREKKLRRLPETTVKNIRTWFEKAHAFGSGGSSVMFWYKDLWDQVAAFMKCVADDGKIDWNPLHRYDFPDNISWLDICENRTFVVKDCRDLERFARVASQGKGKAA